jgi:LysM repeat protein
MIYINKTSAPQSYTNFLSSHTVAIQNRMQNPNLTGGKIWKWFKSNANGVLDDLRNSLLSEQGYVCCYCGEQISLNNVVVEHLEPKSNKSNIFPYVNLYASCIGGNNKPHTIGVNETLATLSVRFNVSIVDLQSINTGSSFAQGTSIRIYPSDHNGKHCDHKKEGDILVNKPNDPKIYEKLCYEFGTVNEVEIKPVDSRDRTLKKDLNDILGLNQKTLKERRAIVLKQIDQLLDLIIDTFQTDDDIISAFLNLYNQYDNKSNGKFESFYFVRMAYIDKQGLKYIDN